MTDGGRRPNIIEDTFHSSTKVIELDIFSCGRSIVVSQDTTD